MPFALTSIMLTLDVPSLDHLTTVSTVFAHREHRITSTDMIAWECVPSIEYSDFGEELSEIVDDVDEFDPEDEYSIFGCGKAFANRVLR
jgi:hypothetical protein